MLFKSTGMNLVNFQQQPIQPQTASAPQQTQPQPQKKKMRGPDMSNFPTL
jgi:hypothetical protein